MAMEQTAFANPVIGTSVPAPANFASTSNQPMPVSRPARKISETDASADAILFSAPRPAYRSENACQHTDQTADEKGFDRIEQTTALFASLRNIVEIVFFIHKIPQPHI